MTQTAQGVDSSYANDLQFINRMYEDDSVWEHIIDAKIAFLNDGTDPLTSDAVRPEIGASWKAAYESGLEPDIPEIGETLPEDQYEMRAAQNARLISATEPLLSSIDSLSMENDYTFELLGADGTSFLQVGNLQLHQFTSDRYLVDEETVGTNAHTLCMQYKRPFVVLGPEHYCFALHSLIACAAPVLDQRDNAIGALLLTQPITDNLISLSERKVLIHAMSLLSTLASTISTQLKLNSYGDLLAQAQLKYSKAYHSAQHLETLSENLIQNTREGILVLDSGFSIMHASPWAALVFQSSPAELVGVGIFDLLAHDEKSTIAEFFLNEESIETTIHNTDYEIHAKRLSDDLSDIETSGFILSFKELPAKSSLPRLGASRKPSGDLAPTTFDGILGNSCQIQKTITLAKRFARAPENVLITGESGTGKELFAQAIHNEARPNGPFITVNCAAIPPRLIESELFGYESGSFTGAEKGGKAGKVELADGGTLFLDEIGDMPLELQATLLRVLENKRVIRVGGTSYKQVDFKLISATNQNLTQLVLEGRFREDLLYRLSVLSIQLPSLRNRTGESLFFARYFLNECQVQSDKGKASFSPEAKAFIESYRWPGNVRQLKHAVYSAYYTSENGVIKLDDFPSYIVQDLDVTPARVQSHESSSAIKVHNTHTGAQNAALPTLVLEELETMAIRQALNATQDNVTEAAEMLGISKATLYRKIKAIRR